MTGLKEIVSYRRESQLTSSSALVVSVREGEKERGREGGRERERDRERERGVHVRTSAGIPPEQNPIRVINDIHRILIKLWL